MNQAKPNYKNALLIGLSAVIVVTIGVALYFYKLDIDFHKPLSCERIAVGYLGSVREKYKDRSDYDQIFRKAIEVETQMFNLCNTDISK
jgi:hypothetical protein